METWVLVVVGSSAGLVVLNMLCLWGLCGIKVGEMSYWRGSPRDYWPGQRNAAILGAIIGAVICTLHSLGATWPDSIFFGFCVLLLFVWAWNV